MMMLSKMFRRGMSCAEVLEVLQSYLDGETDPDIARKVVAHLDRCGRCEVESDVYQGIKVSLAKHAKPIDPEIMSALARFGDRVSRGEVS